jgi:hypothetical protein
MVFPTLVPLRETLCPSLYFGCALFQQSGFPSTRFVTYSPSRHTLFQRRVFLSSSGLLYVLRELGQLFTNLGVLTALSLLGDWFLES